MRKTMNKYFGLKRFSTPCGVLPCQSSDKQGTGVIMNGCWAIRSVQ